MNFWQYFKEWLSNLKKLASFFKFQFISILAVLSDQGSNEWFQCSDKVLKVTKLPDYFWVSIDAGTYFGIVKRR